MSTLKFHTGEKILPIPHNAREKLVPIRHVLHILMKNAHVVKLYVAYMRILHIDTPQVVMGATMRTGTFKPEKKPKNFSGLKVLVPIDGYPGKLE